MGSLIMAGIMVFLTVGNLCFMIIFLKFEARADYQIINIYSRSLELHFSYDFQ